MQLWYISKHQDRASALDTSHSVPKAFELQSDVMGLPRLSLASHLKFLKLGCPRDFPR